MCEETEEAGLGQLIIRYLGTLWVGEIVGRGYEIEI